MSDDTKQVFNDDLLANDGDLDTAAKIYGTIIHILDFPRLRGVFLEYDKPANAAKQRSQRAGFVAVIMGAVALLLAATHQLAPTDVSHAGAAHRVTALDLLAGILGIGAFLVGFGGVMYAGAKREWLCRRLMTERLRQFHFQTIVCRLPEIATSLEGAEAAESYRQERDKWLDRFLAEHKGKLPAELNRIIHSRQVEETWLHPKPALLGEELADAPRLNLVFEAYAKLRVEHQIRYAEYKLGSIGNRTLSTPRAQAGLFSGLSVVVIVLIFLLHFGALAASIIGKVQIAASPLIHFTTLALAIVALGARALEEGMKPERELERYEQYCSAMMALATRFERASNREKLEIMIEAEREVNIEMCTFMRTQASARFVM